MRPTKLTAKIVRDLKPRDRLFEVRDTEIVGLVVRVLPSGRKTYSAVYKAKGRWTRANIGNASIIKLPAAREKAREIISRALLEDVDHNAEKRKPKPLNLGQYIDQVYGPYCVEHNPTHGKILSTLKADFGHLYGKPLSALCETDIERWRRGKDHVTYETQVRSYSALRAALNLAVTEFHLIDRNPLENYRLRRRRTDKVNPPKLRFLGRGVEDVRLRHALYARDIELIGKRQRANRWRAERGKPLMPEWEHYGDHLTPVVLLSLLTGMDIGDVLDLRVDQVDFGNACIRRQRNKTSHKGKVRVWTIPLCNEAGLILERWLRERRITSGLVFTGPTGGKMTSIKTGWRRIVKDADLAGFRAKDLRHSYASWLVQDGVSLFTVSQLLCHSSIAMTQVYAHLSPGHTAEAVAGTFDNDNDEGGQLASKEL